MPNGKLTVRDGCGRVVSGGSDVADAVISADIGSAQPGRWRVQFDFVSATDGHRYGDSYSFAVRGKRDCREEERGQETEANEGDEEQKMGSDDRSRGDMASDGENDDHSGGQSVPVGGLVAASLIAFSTGLIARLRPRAG
jgi:hypothetical protein